MERTTKRSGYVLITPAYNEADLIEKTIQSVVAQTRLPRTWVIVDDGSVDKTGEIVQEYARRYDWIWSVRREKVAGHTYYASNVFAIQEGLRRVEGLDYAYVAILDADIELCSNYYESVLSRFEKYSELGIGTGTYLEREGDRFVEARIDRRSTPKAIQVFRRECYEQIGGYIPFKNGGEDSGAEVLARMNGWQTWSFPDIKVVHNRPVGTGDGRSLLRARFRFGLTDYCLGAHPAFMLCKCVKRCVWERPYVLSGCLRLVGYLYACCRREPSQMPPEAKRFLRKEQLGRLLAMVGLQQSGWAPH
jgi:glycosyltransferase involved in cell wall biosynthesis